MRVLTPEISWHNREAILTIDIQKIFNGYRLVTGGIEKDIKIWKIVQTDDKNGVTVDFLSNLERHQSTVNVLRFSPDGLLLASGDSEGVINVWKQSTSSAPDIFSSNTSKNEDETVLKNAEIWLVQHRFRDHRSDSDVCDLCWSPDSKFLLSGSTDCSLIIFDVSTGKRQTLLQENDKRFPVGVCWDPKSAYFISLSNDRVMNIYSVEKFHKLFSITSAEIPSFLEPSKKLNFKLFHDSSLMSYVRRPSFTPGGDLFIAPAGCIEEEKNNHFCTYVFTRHNLKKPVLILPSPKDPSIIVSCCPILFKLKSSSPSLFTLPYRVVFAVLTKKSVILYDTQQTVPIAFVSEIHYVSLTDCSWSDDGKILFVSSEDGYCTIILFENDELGEIYDENTFVKPTVVENDKPPPPKATLKTFFEMTPPPKTTAKTVSDKKLAEKSPVSNHVDVPDTDIEKKSKKPGDDKTVKIARRVTFTTLSNPVSIQDDKSTPDIDMKEKVTSEQEAEKQRHTARRVTFVTLAPTPIGQDIVEKAISKPTTIS